MEQKEIHILLVDDDEIVHKAIRRVLAEKGLPNPLLTAKNGEEGMSILCSPDGPISRGVPVLVILDINMPKMNGHEFLKELRANPRVKDVPVFVITTSEAHRDLTDAYVQDVIGYVIKDDLAESLEKALEVLKQGWRFG